MTEHRAQRSADGSGHVPVLDETNVWDAVRVANIPTLLMVVYQVTGDERWLEERYRPTRGKGLTAHDSGGLPEEVQDEIRVAGAQALLHLQNGGVPAIATLSPEAAVKLTSIFLGEEIDGRYGPLLAGEIHRRSATGEAVIETKPLQAPEGFKFIMIGLGIAGIAGAHYLEQMGADYTVFERRSAAGGVWHDNTYPGAGVDTPSHLYSFSFFDRDWKQHFELRDELHQYFADAVEELGIRPHVRFDTEVLSATFDDSTSLWTVAVRSADGSVEEHTANVVITAVGSLNKPKLPKIPGIESFSGTQFHSSRWPEGLDLKGKRVAVIGVGASSQQISPKIATDVEHLTIFQRSPQWIAPFPMFRKEIVGEQRMLLRTVRLYHAWYWLRMFWQFGDKVIEALRVDPEWDHPERSVNARNDGHRRFYTRYILEQLEGRPDLIEKSVPDYPPFGKRILMDNGWFKMLRRDNVSLVTEGVSSVTAAGPVSQTGQEYPVDVIIWATGFDASYFLDSLDVYGVQGAHLREVWEEDDPKAYLGVTIPGFPNFFMLGGPHSFPGSGSFMYFMEVQMRYLRDLITGMLEMGVTAVDAREDVTERYNQLVDEIHATTVWTHPGFGTYYRNSKGRVTFVMPFLNLEYWEFTRRPDYENYTFRYADGTVISGEKVLGSTPSIAMADAQAATAQPTSPVGSV